MSSSDVLVYGATAAGVMAAVAASRMGARATLVAPDRHVGGMVSGGLSWTDVGDPEVVGGLAREFYRRVATAYGAPLWALRGPEPHVAERLLGDMLEEAGVDVRLGETAVAVGRAGAGIGGLRTDRQSYVAGVYVDAGYEGDLMTLAGVPYRVGREPRSLYGERWAGRQPATRPGRHNFPVVISPFRADGTLLPFVQAPELDRRGWPRERLGCGDGRVQAYAFRLCLTDRPPNRLPVEAPAGYDPSDFEVLRRLLQLAGDRLRVTDLIGLVTGLLPGGKCDVNSIGPFSLNLLDGSNQAYAEGDAATRAAIRAAHLRYSQALLYYLGHDTAVPQHIRTEVARWGPCADEFTGNDGWPHQLYIREARRMTGAAVLTEHHLLDGAAWPDGVAAGSYNIDIREMCRTWEYLPEFHRTAAVFNEGYLSVAVPRYEIPYRCLTPRPSDCANLLVPVCLSASHVAFGSVRMEPTLMELGHAAGAAAALAAAGGISVHAVDVARLRAVLGRRLPSRGPGKPPPVKVLLTGWFSFDTAEVTAGDLLARDTTAGWLRDAGIPHDAAVAANFRRPGEVSLGDVSPRDYTDVVFVCGPAAGQRVEEMFARFPGARHLALDVSVVAGTARLPLDAVVERDSDSTVNPDLSLATPTARTPVVGVVLAHDQPEYGSRHRLGDAHAILGEVLTSENVARMQIETRLHPREPHLCSTVEQVESAFARCDAVVTTRMHGMVLALKSGVPALALDPVAGGGKVSRQAQALGWPAAVAVDSAGFDRVAGLLRWCLSAEARAAVPESLRHAQPGLREVHEQFIGLFGRRV